MVQPKNIFVRGSQRDVRMLNVRGRQDTAISVRGREDNVLVVRGRQDNTLAVRGRPGD